MGSKSEGMCVSEKVCVYMCGCLREIGRKSKKGEKGDRGGRFLYNHSISYGYIKQ